MRFPLVLALVGSAVITGGAQDTRPSFSEFLAGIRTEALARGIREDIVDEALSNIDEPLPVVIQRDRSQAEAVLSLEKYLARQLTPKRIAYGREMADANRDLLTEVAD